MPDTELLEDFSKLIGERRVVTATISNVPEGQSTSETHRWERLAPIEDLRTLAEDSAVVVKGSGRQPDRAFRTHIQRLRRVLTRHV